MRDPYSQKLIISIKSKPVSDTTFISGAVGFQDSCPHIMPVMRLRTRTSCLVKDCHLHCSSVTSEMRGSCSLASLTEQNRAGCVLKSSVVGPENDSIEFLSWLPVIMLEFWKLSLFHLSNSEGRAWTEVWAGDVPQAPVEMLLAEA